MLLQDLRNAHIASVWHDATMNKGHIPQTAQLQKWRNAAYRNMYSTNQNECLFSESYG